MLPLHLQHDKRSQTSHLKKANYADAGWAGPSLPKETGASGHRYRSPAVGSELEQILAQGLMFVLGSYQSALLQDWHQTIQNFCEITTC